MKKHSELAIPPAIAYFYCARSTADLMRANPDKIILSILK